MPQNPPWRQVRLREILTYVEELVPLDDFREYITITVKRRHGGLEARERLLGHEIKTKKQFRLIPGAFIISRIQCWHQAYAVVPEDAPENMIASQNYDQFTISPAVDDRFFWWFSHSPLFTETVRSSAFGVVIEKMVFNREAWLEKEIPLPPLDEQRRIVSRIEELAARVEESRRLRDDTMEEAKAVLISGWRLLFEAPKSNGWRNLCVEECCEAMIDYRGRTPPLAETGIPHLTSRNIKSGQIDWRTNKFVSEETYKKYMTRGLPRPGDVIFTMEAPLGDAAVVPDERRFSLAQRTLLLRAKRGIVDGEFLTRALMSPQVRESIYAEATGTTVKGIASKRLKHILLPIPQIAQQKRIVAYLDGLQAKLEALQQLQSETAAELEALMPSILSKAFRGEL